MFRGNFAKVFACENQDDKKMYAMKCVNKKKLNKMLMGNKKAQYSFLESEMAILKKLVINIFSLTQDHPNVL